MSEIIVNETVTVAYETDVLVVGGGPAGIGAAFTAAREGCEVIVVEQANCLGGIATAGLHGHMCQYSSWSNPIERVVGGVGYELCERIVREGYGHFDVCNFDFEVEAYKYVLEKMAAEIGKIKLLYYTQFSNVIMDGNRITHVIVQNKSGRQAIQAARVIDCTGDADVAFRAGVPCNVGRAPDGATQPMTLMFQLGGVDYESVQKFRSDYAMQHEDENPYKLKKVWANAQAQGDMEPFQNQIMGWWWTPTRPDQIGVNFTHIYGRSCIDAEDLTFATIEGRRQAFATVDVYRKYVPGLQNSWMSHSAAIIGTRESRRIHGEYHVTTEDLLSESEFEDSIGYGSFFIDIHNCSGSGMDERAHRPDKGFKYQIPYRALVPVNVDNLLVAGRCISCSHEALGSLRVMPQCMLEGEACGAAMAQSLDVNCTPRDVDLPRLQDTLRSHGAIISSSDIVTSN